MACVASPSYYGAPRSGRNRGRRRTPTRGAGPEWPGVDIDQMMARVLVPPDDSSLTHGALRLAAKGTHGSAICRRIPTRLSMRALDVVVSGRAPFLGRFAGESESDFAEAARWRCAMPATWPAPRRDERRGASGCSGARACGQHAWCSSMASRARRLASSKRALLRDVVERTGCSVVRPRTSQLGRATPIAAGSPAWCTRPRCHAERGDEGEVVKALFDFDAMSSSATAGRGSYHGFERQ